jgi:hypothetical protein
MPVAGVAKSVERRPDSLPDHPFPGEHQQLALPGVTFTATGLGLAPGIPFDSWERLLSFLAHLHDRVPFWLGDAIVYGEACFGEEAAQAIGRSPETMRGYAWVSERIPASRRRASLSWSAHRAVAALPPHEADALLDRAEAEGLGARDLRALTSAHRAEVEPDELVSLTLRVPRATAAELHRRAQGRSLSEVVTELVGDAS